jgi:hypothetical protein
MKTPKRLVFFSVTALMALPSMAYENLSVKMLFTDALDCTNSKAVHNGAQAHQSLLKASALDKSKMSLVGPDLNAEKYLNDAAKALEGLSTRDNPNAHCYQSVLTLLTCYHQDNCK